MTPQQAAGNLSADRQVRYPFMEYYIKTNISKLKVEFSKWHKTEYKKFEKLFDNCPDDFEGKAEGGFIGGF
ncbi:MAG: hypothetical protein HY840_04615 [Bacteroidetes bacterium]|nr:hypothetical protein [Bacteroidota bacterium]